jgi:hypothetical protein
MQSSARRLLVSCVIFTTLGVVAVPAHGTTQYTPESPGWVACDAAIGANLQLLEATFAQRAGSTVYVGTPVTFSSVSSSPLSFAIASSPTLLSTPDIDSGAGSPAPAPPPDAPGSVVYSFTSTKATATARTVYWTASFSSAGISGCAGQPQQTRTTRPESLAIVARPGPAPEPASATAELTISAPHRFDLRHPFVVYQIHCTVSCSGETNYHVLILRPHRHAIRVSQLDQTPTSFAVGTGQREWRFSRRLDGRALRVLRHLLHDRSTVAFALTVTATDVTGEAMHAVRSVRLYP